ncbi:MAG: hypothetical protein A2339_07795 [Elusimicrobia bacterium RIFOXYB12_FULL_50_12]|nr:MAG: hypothetical protein A2278_02935 [Elusimicrobia bacterium RIFOXYA12_FULL_49_49]OGS10133.1 MAG: hypothetical protein A2386_02885 [Elusimicrobia bacterium RIFOXYB1_FULL_48_9]OGS16437.1 MAG: hypothetical protein A2251_06390 [Elusimicrobia bacterium RIFOXYA2_FULL_47_53]OGS27188.1 MAG: hypothetical protein A2339_07795 [Elusimicrobia bacterium RIFOXYB12_FULL_50_12]OGS30387.1 MAG: hypothetical protein A2323_02655 [Elusimicrobia bacterium RIFOXYB2_FULL_46_23]
MSNERLLVVDDDESVLEYLEAALEVSGYSVVSASTATEALGKMRASAEKFPVILSDIMMPGLNGLEFLKIIKKDFPDSMVLMLTAHTSMDTAVKSLNEGAFAYLAKPINIDELKNALKNAYDRYRLIQENKRLVEELNKAKDYLENIVQNLVHIVVATDSGGVIKKTNRALENLLGYTESELIGSPLQKIFSDEFKQTALSDLMSKGHVKDFPVIFLAKDRRQIRLTFTGTIMKDVKGQVVGFLGTAETR